jgi:ATP-binding cassette subfamily B protein
VPILVLDEATSSVDSAGERAIQEAFETLAGRRTTLVIAHRLSTIADADDIVVLRRGRVVERGDHETLLAKGGEYAALWRRQTRET